MRQGAKATIANGKDERSIMSTLRALSRFIGMVLFALAVVFAIGDIARYVADDVIRFSTIAEIAQTTGLGAGLFAGTSATAAVIGTWPFSITAAVVGSLFVILGRKPRGLRRRALV